MGDFKVLIGTELDSASIDSLKQQISGIKTNPIKIEIDTSDITSQISKIKEQIKSLNNVKINFTGDSVRGGATKNVSEVTKAYNDLMNIQKHLNSTRIKINGLDATKDVKQISTLSGQLQRLQADYNNLYQTFNKHFSTDQLDNLNRAFEVTNNQIAATNSKMSDTSAVKQQETAYKELLNISQQISKAEIKLTSLKGFSGHSNEISVLKSQLDSLKTTYQQLFTSMNGQLSTDQFKVLNQITNDTANKINILNAKIQDTKQQIANTSLDKFANDTGKIEKISEQFTNLKNKTVEVQSAMQEFQKSVSNMQTAKESGNIDKIVQSYKEYENAVKRVSSELKRASSIDSLNQARTSLSSQMDVWLKNSGAATTQFGVQVRQLQAELKSCDQTRLNGIKNEFSELKKQAELAGVSANTFGKTIKSLVQPFASMLSYTMMVTRAITALKNAFNNVVEVDTAMTELYRITDLTSQQYDDLYDKMVNSAKEYGSTLSDAINSVADWTRLGFDPQNESKRLAEITTMYQHVTDLDNSTAINNLVTAYKGFQEQLLELTNGDSTAGVELIADIYDKLGNEFAVSAADIGEALTNCASTMDLAGNTLQQTAGMATGIVEVTQDPSKAGNSLKILSMRLRGMKGDLEKLGEEVDENVESISKMQTQVLNLTHGKVNIFEDDGSFKSTYEIMNDISKVYDKLTDTEQANLLETIAGKNRGNEIAALLKNFDQVEAAFEAATNAAGTASEEQEKYMDSLQGRLDVLTSAGQSLSASFLDSDFLKGAIDGLTNFINLLDILVNKVGSLGTIGLGAGIAGLIVNFKELKNLFIEISSVNIADSISKIGNVSKIVDGGTGLLTSASVTELSASLEGLSLRQAEVALSTTALTEAQKQQVLVAAGLVASESSINTALATEAMAKAGVSAETQTLIAQELGLKVATDTCTEAELRQALATHGIVGADAEAVMANLGLTASNTTTAFSFKALGASIGTAITALKTFFTTNPLGWAIIAGAAILSVVKAIDAFTESYSEAQEKSEDARKEAETAASEYESVKNELQSVKDKISEINSLGGAKVTRSDELEQLQKQEKTLENQLKIKEKIAKHELQESANASNNLLNKKKRVQTGYQSMPDGSATPSYANLDIIDETEYYYKELEKAQKAYDKLLEKHKDTKIEESSWWQSDTQWEKEEKQLQQYDNTIEEMNGKITDNLKTISEEYDSLSDSQGNALEGCEDTIKRIDKLFEHATEDVESNSEFITSIDIKSAEEEIETLKEKIKSLTEDENNGIEIDASEIDEINASLEKAKENKDKLISEKNKQLETAKESLYKEFADNNDLAKWFKKLSSDKKEIIYKIAFEEDISNYSLDDLENRLTQLSMSTTMVQVHVDLTDSIKSITELSDEISAVQSVVNSHSTGVGISPADLESIVGYESALEYVNGTMQLNEEKVRKLTEAKIDEQIATNEATKTQEQVKYLENAKQIELLSNKLQNEKNLTQETTDAIKTRIETLNSENSFIMTNCSQLDMLNSSLSESIGLYQNWKDAQNASESGDMFDDTLTAMKLINDTIKNTESENYGRVGRKDYQASVDLLIPDTVDSEDTNAINKYLNSIKNLFAFDEDKNANALNIQEFCKQAVEKGLMVLNKETQSYEVAGGKLMEDFAKGMNLSMPLVQAMFGELEECGGEFDWGDEVFQTFGDGIVSTTEQVTILTNKLNELKEQKKNGIQIDSSNIKEVQKELEKVKQLKEELTKKSSRNIDSYIDIDKQIQEQEKAVDNLNEKLKNTKGKQAKITAKADVSEAKKELINLKQQQKELQEPTQLELTLKANDIETKIQSINDKISNYKDEKWVAEFAAELSDDEVNQKINNLETRKEELEQQQIEIKAYLDDDEANADIKTLDETEIQDKEFTVKAITQEAETAIERIKNGLKSLPESKNVNITTTTTERKQTFIDTIKNKITGKNKTSGTAKVSGTAKASGDWGNKEAGKTLVGELGRELLVDVNTGKWHTVGDNGAEFVNIPKNAIIFNHLQTEDLLSHGFVASRAISMAKNNARAKGTAMVTGNAMVIGNNNSSAKGIALKNVDMASKRLETASKNIEKATSKKSDSDKKSKSGKSNKKEKSDKTDKVLEKFQNWTSKFFDWIEVRLSRVQDKIDRQLKKAETYAENGKYNKSAKQYKKVIKNTDTLIKANRRGSSRYTQQANKVANKAVSDGLVSKKQMANIKKRVANGTIDIKKYNERTQEVINSYKEFYDKSKDCSKAVFDLTSNMKEYYDSLYNLPLDKAANAVDKLSSKLSVLSAKSEAVAGGGKIYNQVVVENAKSAQQSATKNVKSAKKDKREASKDVKSAKKALTKDKGLTKNQKKAIQQGKTINTDNLNGKALKDAKTYNKAITKKDTADKKVKIAKAKQKQTKKDLARAKAQQKKYKDAPDYQQENDLLEQEIELAKQENEANQKALKKVNSNLVEAKKSKQSATKKVKSTKKNTSKIQTKLSKDKNLSKVQKKAIDNGKKINTKGLSGETLKNVKAYNKAIEKQNKAIKQQKSATTALSSAQNAQNTAMENAAISQAEYTKTLMDNTKAKLDNIVSSYDNTRNVNSSKISNKESQIEYRKTAGEIITRKDYKKIISIANNDEQVAKSALDTYKAEYESNKQNLSQEDKKAALQQIQDLEQAWYDAKKAVLDYKSEAIQSEIDNTQDLLDKLKAENELLAGAIHKNENIVQQIEKTKTYYDLMIEQETNAVRQAELRAEKEKAVRDLLQEQLDNIKEQNSYTSDWYTSQGAVYEAQNETLKIAQGSDNTQSRYNTIMYDKSVQDNVASINRSNAQALLSKLHTSDYGFYNDTGGFVVWEHIYEQYMKGMADYNNMLADSYKAEAQAAQDCYDAWWEQYLKPKKEGLEDLQTIADLQNAKISLENTRGLDTTVSQYNSLIGNSIQQVYNLESQNALLQEQQNLYDIGSTKYRELQTEIDNNSKSILEAKKNQEEWNNAIIQIPFDNIEKVLSLLDAIQTNYESFVNLKTAASEDLSDNDYFTQMDTNDKKIIQRQKERTEAYNDYLMALSNIDGVYGGKTSDEWLAQYYQYDTEINNLKKDNEELKDALRDDVYWRTYERAHDAAKKYADIITGIKDLISEDMYFDKNGKLTKWGLSQVANIVKQYETARKEIQNYSNDIDNLNNLYAEGYYTEREYFDKLNELQVGMLDSASSMKSNINEIIDMYKQMAKSELDALLDLIDKRNEALAAKKAWT